MGAELETGLKNIGEWSEAAARHHAVGAYREALMHGRISGEEACRVIIRVAWPGKRGEDGAEGVPYDLLLRSIQGRALAPPTIVSALHVLRTRGNNALHGGPVNASDSAGALFMLHALMEHIFGSLLQRKVPEAAASALDDALNGRSAPNDHEQVLREALVQEARAENQGSGAAPAADPADLRRIEAEQEAHRARIRDMEELLRQMAARRVPEQEEPVVSVPERKNNSWRWIAASLVAVGIVAAFLLFRPREHVPTRTGLPAPDSTVTTVLILPFAVMQDDPNLDLRFEQLIVDRLRARITAAHLPLRVFIADTSLRSLPAEKDAIDIALRYHADVIFYGELFEPAAMDSGQVRIRFIMPGAENELGSDLATRGFRSLADSASVRIQLAVQGIVELELARRLYAAGHPSAALAVLYDAPYVDKGRTLAAHRMRAACHSAMGDLAPAMRELEEALAMDPGNGATLAAMGRTLSRNGDRTAAIGFYEKAIAMEPRNAMWLLDLADLCGDRSDPAHLDIPRVRGLSAQALAADSTLSRAWDLHGQVLAVDGHYTGARAAYERAIALDSTAASPKYYLAYLLFHSMNPPPWAETEMLLRETVRLDSSHARAMLLLARVLGQGPNKDPALADRLFLRAQSRDPRLEREALARRAKAALDSHDDANALRLYRQLWSMTGPDATSGLPIAVLLYRLGDRSGSMDMLLRCYALDSMHHGVNSNLGTLYEEQGTTDGRRKAIFHLERARTTDPYDITVLERLGMTLALDGQFDRAVPVLEHAVAVDQKSAVGNGYLGMILARRGRNSEAVIHLERSLAADPSAGPVDRELGLLYAEETPPRSAKARPLLQRALQAAPDDARLHMAMVNVLWEEEDWNGAAEHYRRAVELEPKRRSTSVEQWLVQHGVW